MSGAGRVLVVAGLVLVGLGLLLMLVPRIPFLGRLPGDFSFRWGNVDVYFPLATSIIVSLLLTLLLNLLLRR